MTEQDERLVRAEKDIETMREQIDDLEHCLFGNGQPGMKSDLQDVKSGVKSIEKTLANTAANLALAQGEKARLGTGLKIGLTVMFVSQLLALMLQFVKIGGPH